MGADAPSYVERRADEELLGGLLRGEFCYVLTCRQMGKSSLMVRTARRLRERGCQVVSLDLTAIGQNLTHEQWYGGLIAFMSWELELENEIESFWLHHGRLGPVQRFFAAIRAVVVKYSPRPTVIFVDELDMLRSLPFSTDEFLAAIREAYNARSEDPDLNRLRFCLLGVATPTEVAAFAVVYGLFLSVFVYREMDLHSFLRTVIDTAALTGVLLRLRAKSHHAEGCSSRLR